MLWGPFCSEERKPCLFREEKRDFITVASFKKIVPFIDSVISREPGLYVMLDHALFLKLRPMMCELERRNISFIGWLPLAPSLIRFENVSSHMKDRMELHYPHLRHRGSSPSHNFVT